MFKLEWQVFRDTENTEKSQKFSTKRKTRKIAENSVFATQETKISKKILFLEDFKVKIIIENLRLVKLLFKFNKNFTVSVNMQMHAKICLPCWSLYFQFQTLHSLKTKQNKTLRKIQENSENYNRGKSRNLTFQKTENLPL